MWRSNGSHISCTIDPAEQTFHNVYFQHDLEQCHASSEIISVRELITDNFKCLKFSIFYGDMTPCDLQFDLKKTPIDSHEYWQRTRQCVRVPNGQGRTNTVYISSGYIFFFLKMRIPSPPQYFCKKGLDAHVQRNAAESLAKHAALPCCRRCRRCRRCWPS